MTIRYLDGATFKNMILAGSQRVILSQDELNKMNVFPVPDGDTGSNMAALFSSVLHELQNNQQQQHLGAIALAIADAALNGSRGNSGAIVAQFFQGMQQCIGQNERIGIEKFSEMTSMAAQAAYEAISNPVEGTIITVMRDWATWITQNWDRMQDINELMNHALQAARESLIHTPEQLEILSRNHVVDAGAQGFVHFLEGATHYLQSGELPKLNLPNTPNDNAIVNADYFESPINPSLSLDPHAIHTDDLNHQYCTECIIHGQHLNLQKIKEALGEWGDSFVVVGGANKVKIHIHTNSPNRVFREANLFGELLETKADDMWAQYRARINFNLQKHIVLVTDSTCNLPQEFFVKNNIIVLPLQVIINNKAYLDRVNLSASDFLKKMQDPNAQITTSQPTPADTKIIFNKAFSQSPTVIGIFISEKLSGTFQSIQQLTKKMYEDEDLYLFDSRNVTGGLGLIIAEAAKAIQAAKPVATVKKIILDSIVNTTTFVSFTTLKYAIKGGRVSKSSGMLAGFLKILPVLKMDHTGNLQKAGFTFGKLSNRKKVIKLTYQTAKQYKDFEIIIAHADALNDAEYISAELRKKFPHKEISIVETTPILATHAGPGTIAVSVLGKN